MIICKVGKTVPLEVVVRYLCTDQHEFVNYDGPLLAYSLLPHSLGMRLTPCMSTFYVLDIT